MLAILGGLYGEAHVALLKKAKGWRTVAWNLLALISFGVIFKVIPEMYWSHAMAFHASVFAAGNLGLRAVTNTKIGRKA